MTSEQLAEARQLAGTARLGAETEYLRALLRVGLALLDRAEAAPSTPVVSAPPAPPKPRKS